MPEPRESSIPGVPERRFDTGEHIMVAARQISGLQAEKAKLREEFIVCHAAGYPDPHRPWPNTLEEAVQFADEHRLSGVTGEPVDPTPVVKRRVVSDWEVVHAA